LVLRILRKDKISPPFIIIFSYEVIIFPSFAK